MNGPGLLTSSRGLWPFWLSRDSLRRFGYHSFLKKRSCRLVIKGEAERWRWHRHAIGDLGD